jgi:hypothetical protein
MGVPRLLTDMGTPAVYLLRRDLPRANSVDLLSLHRRFTSRRVPPRRYRFFGLDFRPDTRLGYRRLSSIFYVTRVWDTPASAGGDIIPRRTR